MQSPTFRLPLPLLAASVLSGLSIAPSTANAQSSSPPAAEEAPTLSPSDQRQDLEQKVRDWATATTPYCEIAGIAEVEETIWVACGPLGLFKLKSTPAIPNEQSSYGLQIIEHREMDGDVTGLFEQGGRLWAQVSATVARPIAHTGGTALVSDAQPRPKDPPPSPSSAPPALPPSSSSPNAPSQSDAIIGQVRAIEDEEVLVQLTGERTAAIGNSIEFVREKKEILLGEESMRQERLAVGKVVGVSKSGLRVLLGTNEFVKAGDHARLVNSDVTRSAINPPRAGDYWEIDVHTRPFLALGSLGGGMISDAAVGYRGKERWHVQAQVSPLAFAISRDQNIAATQALLLGSFDARLFEVGFGLGGQTVNLPDFPLNAGSGITVAQLLRLGARDGLHFQVQSNVVLFHSEFNFSDLRGRLQVPLGGRAWLMLAGGGGRVGYGYGEVGLRMLLRGNGGPRSFFLHSSVGGAALLYRDWDALDEFGFTQGQVQSLGGPMVGIGGEWRL